MWFDPSALVQCSTSVAISAISATNSDERDAKVANIATIATRHEQVFSNFGRTNGEPLDQDADSKVSAPHTPLVPTVMKAQEEAAIRNWLKCIEENEPDAIMSKCQVDPVALKYFSERSTEASLPWSNPQLHSCNDCVRLNLTGVCAAAIKLGAMTGYRPVLGRKFDHRCPEWKPP